MLLSDHIRPLRYSRSASHDVQSLMDQNDRHHKVETYGGCAMDGDKGYESCSHDRTSLTQATRVCQIHCLLRFEAFVPARAFVRRGSKTCSHSIATIGGTKMPVVQVLLSSSGPNEHFIAVINVRFTPAPL
jgi:hypothetical protein